jgi:hypothetical protein
MLVLFKGITEYYQFSGVITHFFKEFSVSNKVYSNLNRFI